MAPGAIVAAALVLGCSSSRGIPDWAASFDYSSTEIHAIEIGDFGFPYVPVTVGDETVVLPFDTGNMIGISVGTELFDRLGLTATGNYDSLNSAGEVMASPRVGGPRDVRVLGRDLGSRRIYEFEHPSLPGLVGPDFLDGGRFTLDYGSRRIGVADAPLPVAIPGFRAVPLIRSARHPTLILVHGSVEGRNILIQLDTGKSRTVINPELASELGLEHGADGVRIDRLRIGDLSFEVPSAKPVDQTAVDPGLPDPIQAGIGSDILSRFVWTVDYGTGVLWVPLSLKGSARWTGS